MSEFLDLVTSNGIEGLLVGLAVLVIVYLLGTGNVVVSGNQKRLANVVFSILLSGVSLVNPSDPEVLVSAIAMISSSLLYEGITLIAKKQAERKAAAAKA